MRWAIRSGDALGDALEHAFWMMRLGDAGNVGGVGVCVVSVSVSVVWCGWRCVWRGQTCVLRWHPTTCVCDRFQQKDT